MNERITKIVIDTLGKEGVVNSRAFGHWALSDEELEKFAELILADYAKQLVQANMQNPSYAQAMDEYYEQKWAHRFNILEKKNEKFCII